MCSQVCLKGSEASMSKSDSAARSKAERAVALQYGADKGVPVIVASGMGNLAEKMVEVAMENGVPVYEDNSLATILSQMELGREIPEELYEAIVDIYLYFLNFDPSDPEKYRRQRQERMAQSQQKGGGQS
ncbi:EscU/YscU/HrcU family type III secretion system export apparatus switch protein [Angelakisella massiliensis]|uniref:EscU/YscU/HrcU family type III secretion system export apparatus switch protein n=2 Tax=Angelakisella massiliensis TaxID=1871018 RepID=UPI0032C46DC6